MFKPVEKSFDEKMVASEHEMLAFWESRQIFAKLRRQNAGKERWSFLDGPITANNPMGVHHAWGRSLKDCYQRYNAMCGRDQRYQNGFDCQGLWVEVEVEKELGFKSKTDIIEYGLERFINRCKERVERYAQVQTAQSIRLGYWMDWDNSYFTMSDENNYTIWAFLKKCHERGLVYKGTDAMPWCPRCGTGISEQEASEGYKETSDLAVFVKLPLVGREHEFLLVWTTTPWTLPANVACAVHPELAYVQVEQRGERYTLGKELLGLLGEKGPYTVVREMLGAELVGTAYHGPFDDLPHPGSVKAAHRVIAWKDVTATDGTGIVHIAPGCGKEDFRLGRELGLPILGPIDEHGRILGPIDESGNYTEGYGFLTGRNASDVAEDIIAALRERGLVYKRQTYSHRYPHCWRCKTKLLFRAVEEWYIRMDWREEIKDVARQIRWIPEHGRELELDWLSNMGDWMISKKRFWGLALPIFECQGCGHFEVIGSKEELAARAVRGWESFTGKSPHRPWLDELRIACASCGAEVPRIPDVGNPWLDAGIVPFSTMGYNRDRVEWRRWFPADLVLECFPGQFRNWFYALLAMSTMMANEPPFKTLLGHALVRDENGEEMHKSKGNAIWFDDGAERMGVDSMRWLYCRQNPTQNLNLGFSITDRIKHGVFNTWWNVYSFFIDYAIADDYDPRRPQVPLAERQDIDRWLFAKLEELIRTANEALTSFQAHTLVMAAEAFIDSLSTWYVRRCRRRFWRAKNADDRDKLAAYQTLHETLVTLARLLAPIVPFMTERAYQNLVRSWDQDAPESVHLSAYPRFAPERCDEVVARDMDAALAVVSLALGVREARSLRVRQPLAEMIVVSRDPAVRRGIERFADHIRDELNIKSLRVQDDLRGLASFAVKPNGRLLGPKHGKLLPAIGQALALLDPQAVAAQVSAGQPVALTLASGTVTLLADEILVSTSFAGNLAAGEDRGIGVVLDVALTPALEREGFARDIVRHIQTRRRDLDLELTRRIIVTWESADPELQLAMSEHHDTIAGETLATAITRHPTPGDTIDLGGRPITLSVTPV